MISQPDLVATRPSKRAVVDGTVTCIALGMIVGNMIGLGLFLLVFVVYMIAK